ncbi:OLC1v1031726C1 [Oldenlandia corymbosa var. corymbosa]|uniref:OLC1v1031726C1 n=1 Tax=Oldenlandia corymbosa var. corymbosa TaxID=529605 RepID=A0AAV1CL50_OLDCO|nr:OLC1v1031726C1 [Oldenlandia corymbosa var. corymbosa]
MAEAATARANFFPGSGTLVFNVRFRETTIQIIGFINCHFHHPTHPEMIITSRQAIFAFITAVVVSFLQLMYQGKGESPFKTRPKTIWAAIASLFLYCLSHDAKLRSSAINRSRFSAHQPVAYMGMAIFGPLSLASMSSLLFPGNFGPFLYLAAILYSISLSPICLVRKAWNWFEAMKESRLYGQYDHDERRKGSVQIPWFGEHHISCQVDPLPPV